MSEKEVNIMAYFWLILVVVFGIIELCTSQLVSVWFVVGALAAAICANTFLQDQIVWQVAVFIGVSALALLLTRPLVKKLRKFDKARTNADRYIGKVGVVTVDIDPIKATGMVEVDGSKWTARSTSGEIIEANTPVVVDSIEGVKLMVTRFQKEESED